MRQYSFFLALAIICVGCQKANDVVPPQVYSDEEKDIAAAMAEMSKKDCETFYKQTSGLVEYLKNTDVEIETELMLNKVIPAFQKDYGYSTQKAFTDKTEKFLLDGGYKKKKTVVVEVKDETKQVAESKVIADFTLLANAAKCAIESK